METSDPRETWDLWDTLTHCYIYDNYIEVL